VFLGRVLSEVVRGALAVSQAVALYEAKRIPRAWTKQQVSLVSGELNMCSDAADLAKRDASSEPEVKGDLPPSYRSWQMFDSPDSVPGIFYYDAEGDADNAVCDFLQTRDRENGDVDGLTMVAKSLSRKWWNAVDFNGIG